LPEVDPGFDAELQRTVCECVNDLVPLLKPEYAELIRRVDLGGGNYDVVARYIPLYGYAYPFIELLLGVAYITVFQPFATNLATLVVMSASSLGVIQSLLNKRKIRCACLGTVFNLPMSTVTLVEDSLMVTMAAFALLAGGH